MLLAITDWGNAIRNEAAALTSTTRCWPKLERQTGTILETHGMRFYEERYGSIGPLGRLPPSLLSRADRADAQCRPLSCRRSPGGELLRPDAADPAAAAPG